LSAQPTSTAEVYYLPAVTVVTRIGLRTDGASLPLTGGTFTLLDRGGATLVTGPGVVDGDDITFDVPASTWTPIDADTYGRGYQEVWSELTTASGTYAFTRPAAVSMSMPSNPLTDLDLEAMHSGILSEAPDGSDANVPADPGWTAKRDFGFTRLFVKLQQGIVDPTAVLSWSSFQTYLAYDVLWLICWDLATEERGTGKWTLKAQEYSTMRDEEWDRILFDVDRDRTGTADTDGPSQVSAVGHGGHPGNRRW